MRRTPLTLILSREGRGEITENVIQKAEHSVGLGFSVLLAPIKKKTLRLDFVDEALHPAAQRGIRQAATCRADIVDDILGLGHARDGAGYGRVRHDVLQEKLRP